MRNRSLTRRQKWMPYVRQLADLMALKDWQVTIHEDLPSDGGFASVDPPHGRKITNLRLSEEFLNDTSEIQRQTVVHELVHCLQAPFLRSLEVEGCERPAVKLAMEYATDAIADGWAPFLPLPPARVRSKP